MIRKFLLPALAVFGALIALGVVYLSQRTIPAAPILFPPPTSPYPYFIAGAGIIEASSQNISIGTPFNEVIEKIYVIEGDRVKAGDPLFQLDLRAFEAVAESAAASVRVAEATLEGAQKELSFYERVTDRRAVSEDAYRQAY